MADEKKSNDEFLRSLYADIPAAEFPDNNSPKVWVTPKNPICDLDSDY